MSYIYIYFFFKRTAITDSDYNGFFVPVCQYEGKSESRMQPLPPTGFGNSEPLHLTTGSKSVLVPQFAPAFHC